MCDVYIAKIGCKDCVVDYILLLHFGLRSPTSCSRAMEITFTSFSITGMPKEKYDPPDPRRMYTIMSSEEAASGKKSYWAELEISGNFEMLLSFLYIISGMFSLIVN